MGLRRAVDEQRQQLRPAVVTDAVHHAFALGDERQIEIGDHHALALGERRREQRAFRRYDGREATSAQSSIELGIAGDLRHLLLVQVAGGVDHEAA